MKRFMLTAMHSNAGKTVLTCSLLAALKRRGSDVRSFKCGPDYIDPMFHSRVLGVPSRNLDLFLQGESGVKRTLFRHGGELAVLEGAMGYYDGMAGTAQNSAWETAFLTGTPAVLVVRPKGVGISLAAQIRGMMQFREGQNEQRNIPYARSSGIGGILLADCSQSLASYLQPVLERETGLPVLGFMPPMKEAELGSRHLGLMTADEIRDLSERIEALTQQAEKTIDLDALMRIAEAAADPEDLPAESSDVSTESSDVLEVSAKVPGHVLGKANEPDREECKRKETDWEEWNRSRNTGCRIAVARDSAFCFCYQDSLEALCHAGAELVFFSPVADGCLPENVQGIYLCGGYPELYAQELSLNSGMLQSIRESIQSGIPVIAECGGFLYLQRELEDDKGQVWPVCGVFPGSGFRTGRLQRFGYQYLQTDQDSMLFRAGERIPAHEFHYWDCTVNGKDLTSVKPDGRNWPCGYADDRTYAAFPHLHLGGKLPLAERFVQCCREANAR